MFRWKGIELNPSMRIGSPVHFTGRPANDGWRVADCLQRLTVGDSSRVQRHRLELRKDLEFKRTQ
jgi:hypothetical protein